MVQKPLLVSMMWMDLWNIYRTWPILDKTMHVVITSIATVILYERQWKICLNSYSFNYLRFILSQEVISILQLFIWRALKYSLKERVTGMMLGTYQLQWMAPGVSLCSTESSWQVSQISGGWTTNTFIMSLQSNFLGSNITHSLLSLYYNKIL